MKHLLALLLAALLLCGCGGISGEENLPESTTEGYIQSLPKETADPTGALQNPGAVVSCSLNIPDVYGMRNFSGGLLVFSGKEKTTLTLLAPENLEIRATAQLTDHLSPEDPSLRIWEKELSYFKESSRETVVLDSQLRQISSVTAPAGLVGKPVLAENRNALYYCTETAVRIWDLERSVRRTLKEMAYTRQEVSGLHWQDTILQCRITDGQQERTLFLSTEDGREVSQLDGDVCLFTKENRYYASIPGGVSRSFLMGEGDNRPNVLLPWEQGADCVFLEEGNMAVTVSGGEGEKRNLALYDLNSGLRTAELTLGGGGGPVSILWKENHIWILLRDSAQNKFLLCRWDPRQTPLTDDREYLHPYYTAQSPDREGLEFCRQYAREIGEKHGIQILVWKDALQAQPWDYDFEAEYLTDVLERELLLLDQRLSRYPEGMLAQTAAHFSSLNICLVRKIQGSAESGSLQQATGVQYLEGTDAYVVIAVGAYSEQALYHELFHAMETHVLGGSIAFDQWDALNPAGFSYDYDYAANAVRDSGIYLHPENRAFIDTYSMSYPKEDRARILEYAMLPGNRDLFQYPVLQRKLQAVCDGIREAYGLKNIQEIFPWEQYLER